MAYLLSYLFPGLISFGSFLGGLICCLLSVPGPWDAGIAIPNASGTIIPLQILVCPMLPLAHLTGWAFVPFFVPFNDNCAFLALIRAELLSSAYWTGWRLSLTTMNALFTTVFVYRFRMAVAAGSLEFLFCAPRTSGGSKKWNLYFFCCDILALWFR